MKNLLSIIAILAITTSSFAQAPEGFKYQVVVRNASNLIISNQAIGMQFVILQGSATGLAVYTETFSPTSNAYGLVNLEIGSGSTTDDFSTINWDNGPYFIETGLDVSGGSSYVVMGTSQLMSVPYSLYAKQALSAINDNVNDADADSTNELQVMSFSNDTLYLSDGGSVYLGSYGVVNQLVSLANDTLYLSNGGYVYLGAYAVDNVNDADADPTNELQTISIASDTITLSNGGGTIDLTGYNNSVSGTANYVTKYTSGTAVGNSQIRDIGTAVAINAIPNADYRLYTYDLQLTADGDGQASIYGYRTRNTQNNGTAYSHGSSNTAIKGYNYWGDSYTFGVGGYSYNDYTRSGGVIGAYQGGSYWGALGYKNSSSTTFGIYGTSSTNGSGFLPNSEAIGIGGGFFGDLVGSTSQGDVIGQINTGELFAQYNKGNVYTLGKNVELVKVNETVTPMYPVSSTEATVYTKGTVQLVNGSAYIAFTSEYTSLLGETPVVTATPNGECNGIYVSSVDKNGFTVKELMNGTSNAPISWISVGNRIDNKEMDLATQIVSDPSFDRNIQQVLFSDGNVEGSAMGIWWDGQTLQFGELPANLTKVVREGEE